MPDRDVYILVFRQKPEKHFYAIASAKQAPLNKITDIFRELPHYYSFQLYGIALRPLAWQMDASELQASYDHVARRTWEDIMGALSQVDPRREDLG